MQIGISVCKKSKPDKAIRLITIETTGDDVAAITSALNTVTIIPFTPWQYQVLERIPGEKKLIISDYPD